VTYLCLKLGALIYCIYIGTKPRFTFVDGLKMCTYKSDVMYVNVQLLYISAPEARLIDW